MPVTMVDWGGLQLGQYLIHDRDGKYCPALPRRIDAAGVTRVPLPPQSPHLHAYAERWVRSGKEGVLSRLMLCGEGALRHALAEYVAHYHFERPHQGKGNVVLMSAPDRLTARGHPRHRDPMFYQKLADARRQRQHPPHDAALSSRR